MATPPFYVSRKTIITMAAKTTIGIIIFILSMSLFLTFYKIVKSEDEKINPWYLFCSLFVSIGAGTAAFILFEN